jgi:hypothetical protein
MTKTYFGLVKEFIPEIMSKILKQVQDQGDLCQLILGGSNNEELIDRKLLDNLMPSKPVMFSTPYLTQPNLI